MQARIGGMGRGRPFLRVPADFPVARKGGLGSNRDMTIATRTGDDGSTSLLYGRRVPKNHPRVTAYGAVDELTTLLGLARVTLGGGTGASFLEAVQRDLIDLMAELAVADEDRARFESSNLSRIGTSELARLDAKIEELEAETGGFKGWVLPGANEPSARLEQARAVCRRAEREVAGVVAGGNAVSAEVRAYLNRLADVLWLLAREAERG